MDDMHEFCSIESLFVLVNFDVCTDEATHPVVCYDHWWEDLQLAECLQADQGEEDHLPGDEHCTLPFIRSGIEIRVMKPDIINPLIKSSMNTKLMNIMRHLYLNITGIDKAVLSQIAGLSLLIILIIRSQNIYSFLQLNQFLGQLIDHNPQTANWTPRPNFWRYEGNWS